jgi:hypothetical protein
VPVVAKSISQEVEKQKVEGSSVEAARKFLEQVGVADTKSKKDSAPQSKALPERFPGEDGGFMREVSSRRIQRNVPNTAIAAIPAVASSSKGSAEDSAERIATPAQQHSELKSDRSTESQLINGSDKKLRMSAYEFQRRLSQCSAGSDSSSKYESQLALLGVSTTKHSM